MLRKSVRIWSYSGPYFPASGVNTDQNNSKYEHFLRSEDDCGNPGCASGFNFFFSELFDAVVQGNLEKFQQLLHKGVWNINEKYADGEVTLLHTAASNGYHDIVKELLNCNIDIDVQSSYGLTALLAASWKGHLQIVSLLLKNHADVHKQNSRGTTALISASDKGHQLIAIELLNHGAAINVQNNHGGTALMAAADNGHHETVKKLLENHAKVNMQNSNGYTALMNASRSGHADTVKVLLNYHADVNLQCNHGNTALHLSIMLKESKAKEDIVRLLLLKNANVGKANKENKSALDLAKESQNSRIIIYLLGEYHDKQKIDRSRKELKKNKVTKIINQNRRTLHEITSSNDDIYHLHQKIAEEEERVKVLKEEIDKINQKVKTLKDELKNKMPEQDFELCEKSRKDIKCFEMCAQTEDYDHVIHSVNRETHPKNKKSSYTFIILYIVAIAPIAILCDLILNYYSY